jgi:hypothetical protein
VIVEPTLPLGLLANTVATISIGLGAAVPFLGNTLMTDAAGRGFRNSADRPVPILQASHATIGVLLLRAVQEPQGAAVVVFPRFARSLRAYSDYRDQMPTRDPSQEAIDGLGLAGPEKRVRSLTGSLKLLR